VKGNFHARFCSRGGGSDPLVYCNRTAHSAGSVPMHSSVPVGRRSLRALAFTGAYYGNNHRILLANLFPRYNAELYTELFPGLGAFKAVKCEAKF
jgi:hypothetical protein